MSESHNTESFLERYWQGLVIVYGLIFVSILVSFAPTW